MGSPVSNSVNNYLDKDWKEEMPQIEFDALLCKTAKELIDSIDLYWGRLSDSQKIKVLSKMEG